MTNRVVFVLTESGQPAPVAVFKTHELQWGHGELAVDDPSRSCMRMMSPGLQWGHGELAVDDNCGVALSPFR